MGRALGGITLFLVGLGAFIWLVVSVLDWIRPAEMKEAEAAVHQQRLAASREIMGAAFDAIAKDLDVNGKLKADEIDERKFEATFYFDEGELPSLRDGKRITQTVAHDILMALVAAGRSPSDERDDVFVRALQRVSGETGKPLVSSFGYTYYDPTNDRLIYSEP
jgi:hypothetical protein